MKVLLFSALLLSTVCANANQEGVASWYGNENYVSCTGKKLSRNIPALAHRTLPMGTKVKITNIKTKATVVAVVEDRGPYKGNRIADVNKFAAQKLGIIKCGIARVKVELL